MRPPSITRRSILRAGAAGLAVPAFGRLGRAATVTGTGQEVHGLSIFGDLALPADFKNLPYVDPGAPKGGQIALQVSGISGNMNFTTFNTLNDYILKGDGAAGMGLVFDTLMGSNNDEPDSIYGLVARAVQVAPDKNTFRFLLRPEARFHDGSRLTAADIAFSLNILQTQGHPSIREPLRDLDAAEAESDEVLMVRLKDGHSRESILMIASQPIFSKAYYSTHKFDETTLVPPLGSGPYKVGPFDMGHHISLVRVADYWGKDLPINVGQNNFDTVRFEYFGDRKVAFEAFKAGVFTFREEFTSAVWATGYDFAAVTEGRIKREMLPDQAPMGTQGWFLNTRREKFSDPRIREAIGYAFDFEWTNANIMYGVYKRTVSYFQNSPMEATGLPSPAELALLDPFKDKLSPAVFGPAYMPPVSDKSGQDRTLLKHANDLLLQAGCKRQGTSMLLPNGAPFDIEFLDFDNALQPHTMPFIANLRLLGIDARYRVVDPSQYKRRTDDFDYDIVTSRFGLGLTPGEALRSYFGSAAAKMAGSHNVSGIANPVIDALIADALVADTRAKLTVTCKALDRVLRAGHYWVPMWNKPNHLVAFWDMYSRPARSARYDIGVISTWWYDEEKAKRINFASR